MKYFILFVLPLIISCSLFDNEQALEINPNHLIGEWRTKSFYDDLELIEPAEFDTSQAGSVFGIEFINNNTCRITPIKPPHLRIGACEWVIYGYDPEVYLRIQYTQMIDQWPIDYSFLYRVKEISNQNITLDLLAKS
ncbi:MAG: hypothetical protein JJ895_06055 [Balneolaceae bacterium]|nr:hypothetical protein [Balneolaceae bacterium]